MKQLIIGVFLIFLSGDCEGRDVANEISSTISPAASIFDPSSVVFYLYTRLNPSIKFGQVIRLGNIDSLKNSNYNESKPTRFIVHGFRNNYKSPVNEILVGAYLKNADFNVIVADWGKGANLLLAQYSKARKNVPAAGKRIGLFIDFLYNSTRNSTLDFHENTYIVGHSLGAHVAGFAGRSSQHGKPGVIVGLDPAGPEFDINKPMERLNNEDAKYVHVIHTNLHQVIFQLGISEPIGDADFYPNYGLLQTGCIGALSSMQKIIHKNNTDSFEHQEDDGIAPLACNHDRSYFYFAESLESDQLIGVLCRGGYYEDVKKVQCDETGTYLKFGGLYLQKNEGVFYFPTNGYYPFGRGTENFGTMSSRTSINESQFMIIIITILFNFFQ